MQPAAPSFCAVCGIRESLWLCMLCGHVGCGRYTGGHAVAHFNATGHAFALDLLTQRAWDYAADGWVHRLIATHSAEKLVEWLRQRERHGDAAPLVLPRVVEQFTSVKLEHLIGEFNFLLSSQLGRQRAHFQALLSAAVERHMQHLRRLRDDVSRMEEVLAHLSDSQAAAQDSLERYRARCSEAELALGSVNAQLSKLHKLNASLLEQQSHRRVDLECQEKRVQAERDAALAAKDAEIAQLEEQIQDIGFAIRTHKAISRNSSKHDLTDAKFYMVSEAGGIGGGSSARDRLRKKLSRGGRPG